MNELKSESLNAAQSCDNKPTEAIRNHTLALESLLKEIYNNHKETIRLCREEQKEKFTKIVALKNKMFEKGKEIQKECNIFKKENQDLKEVLSSRTVVPCKNCDHLRRSFDSLEEAYKRSLSEKDKMIRYLEAQLNGQHHSVSSDQNKVSPKSSPESQKNRLRLKASQKRVVYKESPEENALRVPSSIATNSKPPPLHVVTLLNVPETCLPDTCAADMVTSKKAVEYDEELTVVPDTLALFNPWDSDGETDQNLSKIPEEDIEKSLVLESPYNKPSVPNNTDLIHTTTARPSKNVTILNEIDSIQKTVSSEEDISAQSNNNNPVSSITVLPIKGNSSDKAMKPDTTVLPHVGSSFKSPTKSPLRKKRRQLSNENSTLANKEQEREEKKEHLPLQSFPNGQIIKQPSSVEKKLSRRSRSRENGTENCEFDADQTLPPENWGNETLINDSAENIAVDSVGDNPIWHTACPPASQPVLNNLHKKDEQVTQMNGSLAPSMCMTQFLEENGDLADERKDPAEKSNTKSEILEVESCSQVFPSRSYKFGAVKSSILQDVVTAKPENVPTGEAFCDSFDHIPEKEEIAYAHHNVVRKKVERRKLNGYTCRECVEYYQTKGLTEEEIRKQVGDCSRHRAKYEAPQTPEHFWSVDFPDTIECEKRGYFTKDESRSPGRLRRRRRYQQSKAANGEEGKKQKEEEEIGMTQMLEYLSAESCDED